MQVYGSEMTPRGATVFEFHTNVTARGTRDMAGGELPTHRALHETIEITHGWNEWFETGHYTFLSRQADGSWKWVGTHLRPRVGAPESWHLPVGLGLSTEIGYQRPNFSADTWTLEVRPITDKSFHGPESSRGWSFSPNLKLSYEVHTLVAAGVEYYGSYGPLTGFDPLRKQQHQILPALDLDLGDRWECNFGVGVGMTRSTDHLLIKWILGYRLGGRKKGA